MAKENYLTGWMTLVETDSGSFHVTSDGLVEEKEYSIPEIKRILQELEKAGWSIVASIKRDYSANKPEVLNLFFRKTLPAATSPEKNEQPQNVEKRY